MPIADVDDVDHTAEQGVGHNAVLGIFRTTQCNEWMMPGLFLPLGDGLEPETGKMQRTGVFGTQQVHGIGLVFQGFQAHPDILAVEGAQRGVGLVVELLGHEHALVTGKGNGLGEGGAVDVVHGAPRTVYPMGTGLEDVVLEIVLVEEQDAMGCGLGGKLIEARPVPPIGLDEVVERQSVPGGALSAPGEGLLVEWGPHVAIGTAHTLMVGAAQVIP